MAFSSIIIVLTTFESILEGVLKDIIELGHITNIKDLLGLKVANGVFDSSFCIHKKLHNVLKRLKTLARSPFEKKLK